jgi:tRNA(Ile)-lysidine synthetase-like protein
LRAWVGERAQLTGSHWQALEQLLLAGRSGRTIQLPDGWRATREFDQLRLWQVGALNQALLSPVRLVAGERQAFGQYEFTLHLSPPPSLAAGQNFYFVALPKSLATRELWLRTRQSGDAYVPAGRSSAIKLKTLMIRQRIPRSHRAAHPLLVTGMGDIVWSPQLPYVASFQAAVANTSAEDAIWVEVRERCNLPPVMGVMSE